LLLEGVGRTRAESQRRAPRRAAPLLEIPDELPPSAARLGSLRAVFQSHNSARDALVIAFIGLAFGCAEPVLLDWLGGGRMSAKLILSAVFAPALALYLLYRAARTLYDRQCLLVFAGGIVHRQGGRANVYPWDKIAAVSRQEIGDAIDEHAVELRFVNGCPPLRFTCAHFRNLDKCLEKLQQAFLVRCPKQEGAESESGLRRSAL
jgi:hypothetical protein